MTNATRLMTQPNAGTVNVARAAAHHGIPACAWRSNETVIGMSFRSYKRPRPKENLLR
jgi:hypothetical protein